MKNTCILEGTCLSNAERILDIVNTARIAVFVLDADDNLLDVNDAWLAMHGMDFLEEVLGAPVSRFLEDAQTIARWGELAERDDCTASSRGELAFRRADGSVGRALYTVCRLLPEGESPARLEGLLVDVSDKVELASELREANQRLERAVRERTAELERTIADLRASQDNLRIFFDNTSEAVFVHDLEGGIVDVNDEMLAMYGTTRDEVSRHQLYDYMAEGNPMELLVTYWEEAMGGERVTFSWLARRMDDGREFPVVVVLRRVSTEGRDVILANVRDMTEAEAAREQLELFGKVFENALEGISITDEHGTIISVNPAFEEITGYSPAEAIGQNPRILRSEHHDDDFYRQMWKALGETGRWEGEIWNRRKGGEVFPEWLSISRIPGEGHARYIAVFHDITEMKNKERQILHQAHHDPLTDLPNRLLLRDRLRMAGSRARRGGWKVAVVFVDLDDFKNANDAFGHAVGDEIIKDMARRLGGLEGPEDTLSRIGSDEFVLLMGRVDDENAPARMAGRIAKRMNRPFRVAGNEVFLTCSVGIALFPEDGEDAEELLKNADLAMSRAKELGKNTYALYAPAMHSRVNKRIRLEGDMRKGLMRREFVPFYQPKIDVLTGRVTGMEALMRWFRPDGAMVSPGDFIPLAEETGLIVSLGEQFALMVASQAQELAQEAPGRDLVVSVNVSPRQFQQQNLVPMLRSVLDSTGIPARLLEVEITETAIMTDIERTVDKLNELKEMGISLSIDDFGTGYSSLAYLKRFPIDVLKIDQSFIRDLGTDDADASIVATIIDMARNMGMHTVAEGVETTPQAALLKRLGCTMYQGFLYSRPLPFDEFKAWLKDNA